MKIVVVSDPHVDWKTYGRPRYEEIAHSMRRSVQEAIDINAGLWICLGDWSNPDSGPVVFHAMAIAIATARRLSDHRIRNLWLPGNHDVIEDGTGISTFFPLSMVSDWTTVLDVPQSGELMGLMIHSLPFTPSSHPYDPEEFVRSIQLNQRQVQLPQIVLSHLQPDGVVPGEESTEMARGRSIRLPREAIGDHFFKLGTGAPFILQGHIHNRQRLLGYPEVQIVGSMAQLTHGEEEHEPAFLVVDIPTIE